MIVDLVSVRWWSEYEIPQYVYGVPVTIYQWPQDRMIVLRRYGWCKESPHLSEDVCVPTMHLDVWVYDHGSLFEACLHAINKHRKDMRTDTAHLHEIHISGTQEFGIMVGSVKYSPALNFWEDTDSRRDDHLERRKRWKEMSNG